MRKRKKYVEQVYCSTLKELRIAKGMLFWLGIFYKINYSGFSQVSDKISFHDCARDFEKTQNLRSKIIVTLALRWNKSLDGFSVCNEFEMNLKNGITQ